jgi:hypothetical protein
MKHTIINREFRDMTSEAMYPFQDTATLTSAARLHIPADVFLDLVIYSLLPVSLPFFLYALDGTYGNENEVRLLFRDQNGRDVCFGQVDTAYDTAILYDAFGRTSGTVVYSPEGMQRLARAVHGTTHVFTARQTPILVERCFVSGSAGITAVQATGINFLGDVYVVAASGMHFTKSEEVPGEVVVHVHMLGEEPTVNRPVRSINGIVRSHIWLAADPSSSVKVQTTSGNLKIWNIVDDN